MNELDIRLQPREGESLSPLVLALLREFPDLPDTVDVWEAHSAKSRAAASGEVRITELQISWRIPYPDATAMQVVARVIEIIKKYGYGDIVLNKISD